MNPGWEDRRERGSLYHRRDIAVLGFCCGLLTGLIIGFASCSAPEVLDRQTGACVENCR